MAGRPKDPTVNQKIYAEIERLLVDYNLNQITVDQIAENTGVSKATIYRRWPDKSFIIMDLFLERAETFHPAYLNLYDDLYRFLVTMMNIYKTPIGTAVIEILVSHHDTDAKARFMEEYFLKKRAILKSIIEPHIHSEDEDMLIDLIFSPIYFNILIKPDVLNESYIETILTKVLQAYDLI
ncbi:transcriptional regulator [Staphylococcus schleiferi]|uniref:TetR/AcrR family transcriptional regulator n=1 Tax=Staphylococcus coagulans TaxID=74706 RepID=A0ABU1EWS6_9STAP|nr:TetR/AcrR family transcriptional regulator [Staphylococcus coagulans]AKS68161.1 transcriptional regulator [Staphylococcus schleiferi]AKS70390.1 transcriptional regulator [Staphylococcus schleiferi]AKS72540.1 transcriptional regulator [Staphylococcus schleiferi]MBA8764337.1 TetR family transcriptional regulator [Staphylococcus coagulans]MBT2809797.1 TetR/AcrR family transcriptional regulator [Staphylococcus coagulans]